MKIVFVGPFGLQPKTTMSVRALPLAKALVARGHQVTVLIPPWDDPERSGQSWEENEVQIINVPLPARPLSRLPILFHPLLTRSLVKQALAQQPQVIHLFKPKAYAGLSHLGLWWLRRLRNLPVRLVVDTDDWERAWNERLPYSAGQKKFFAWQEKWGLGHADAVTVASRALAQLIPDQFGVDPGQVFYLPNGCRPEMLVGKPGQNGLAAKGQKSDKLLLSPQPFSSLAGGDRPTILLFSRFAEFRLDRIVTLIKLVAEQAPQARWLVVGRGFNGEEKELAAKLTQTHLRQYTHFISDWIPPDRVPAYLAAADVAVHPYDDTLLNRTKCSVRLIDLLAAGVPVVADGVGQNCEYIEHDVSGLLVPPENDTAFSQSLVRLLQEPDTRQRLGQAAARSIQEKFTWPHLAQIAERAYF